MGHPRTNAGRAYSGRTLSPRKKINACLLLLLVFFTITIFKLSNALLQGEDNMEEILPDMKTRLLFLEAHYIGRQEDVIFLQAKMFSDRGNSSANHGMTFTTVSHAAYALLKNMTGTRGDAGVDSKHMRIPFVYQLLPQLMNDSNSWKPAYHMRGRHFSDMVAGILTVKRDKESYLMFILTHLVSGLTPADINSTPIVVMIGETDLKCDINTARQMEVMFPTQVENSLTEVVSTLAAYYPNFTTLRGTLGDSRERVKRRLKQNLDIINLMAYVQCEGIFYLMLEDVNVKKNYVQETKQFTVSTKVANPNWFFIEYCHVGGIGKLFRSADLIHLVTYVQLFYNNMLIYWLLESYLADRKCTFLQSSDELKEH